MKTHERCWHRWRDRRAHMAEAHMETARRFITAIRRGDLECWSFGIPRGMMAAAVTTALATCALFFAPAVFAQPASDSLGELLVGKAAFGDWRTDAPLVRRKITDLLAPYTTRSASNPPRVPDKIGITVMQHMRAAGDAQCAPFAPLRRSLDGWPDGLDCCTDRHACSKRDDVWPSSLFGRSFSVMRRSTLSMSSSFANGLGRSYSITSSPRAL